jgi:hypothetical protein
VKPTADSEGGLVPSPRESRRGESPARHPLAPWAADALVQQSAREALALLVELEKREPSRAAGAAERKRALAGAYVEAGGVLPEEMEPLAAGVPRPPSTDWAAMPCDTLLEGIGRYANPRLALRMIAASRHRDDPAVAERRRAHLYALERFDEEEFERHDGDWARAREARRRKG